MRATNGQSSREKMMNREMEENRIQRLLSSEYTDFSDTIIVESSFAETTRSGRGIRQVSLGLTSTKLIVAADVFRKDSDFFCPRDLDPSIESFELISVYPLQYVTISVFSRRRRKTLKIRRWKDDLLRARWYSKKEISLEEMVRTGRPFALKNSGWKFIVGNHSCELVEQFNAVHPFIGDRDPKRERRKTDKMQVVEVLSIYEIICYRIYFEHRVWAHYGGAGDQVPPTWTRKDLYLGPSYNELSSGHYKPVPVRFAGASLDVIRDELVDLSPNRTGKACRSWPTCRCSKDKRQNGGLCDVLFIRDHSRKYYNAKFSVACQSCPCSRLQDRLLDEKRNVWYNEQTLQDSSTKKDEEPPSPRKYLTQRISRFGFGVPEKCHSGLVLGPTRRDRLSYEAARSNEKSLMNQYVLMESGVRVWEGEEKGRCRSSKRFRHFRRYGLCTAAHFLYALGPWSVQPGERTLLQGRRSFSLITVRRQPVDSELRLPVSRRQLATSVSHTALQLGKSVTTTAKGRVILFWTPDYWYRPRPAAAAYRELRQHLNHLRVFRQEKERPMKRKLFSRKKKHQCEEESTVSASEERPSLLGRIFSANGSSSKKKIVQVEETSATIQLRRLLRMDFRITIWDIDSTTLATQLTLIDRDLFVRIPSEEIEILVFQRHSRNAPNLAAWVAFSHRVSCLTVSEILAIKKLAMRSRIIARFINAANKCFAMRNFHSCRSILAGLQAPPVYRLRSSWSYLRNHHANRYEMMERLCKLYRNPCSSVYRRAWTKTERNAPCMPYVGDLLSRVLGLNNPESQRNDSYHRKNATGRCDFDRFVHAKSANVNKDASCLKSNQDLEQRQGFSKRILESVLTKIKGEHKTIYEEKTDVLWTSREQDLAWKYFYRWNNIVLRRKACLEEEEKLRNMDPRIKRVLDVVCWLLDCQRRASGFDFPGHSFTREFLLKSRYKEDRENFFISMKLEPPMIT